MKSNFKVKAVRTVTSPSNEKVTTYFVWTEFRDLPSHISLEVNPRKPKMNTAVAKQLIAAVKNPETNFDLNNRGIVVTAKGFKFNTNDHTVHLDLGEEAENTLYGILDGGHTYTAIVENRDELPNNAKKYVRLEILVGEELDVSSLADARNTSAQVSDIALFELDDKFEFVKAAINNEIYKNEVAYKDNDNKRIPVAELLKLMFAFNIKRFPDDSSAPVSAYSGKAAVFRDYKKSFEDGQSDTEKNIYELLAKQLPKLVELYERIQSDLPGVYATYKKETDGNTGRFGGIRGIESRGDFTTLFTAESISHNISIGFILPIFGAFRALLDESENDLKWSFDPIEIWEKAAVRLVQNTFDTDTNPQLAGKSKTLWQSNYRIVDSVRKDMLLEQLMKQMNEK